MKPKKSSALPTPHVDDADAVQADPDALPADSVERSLTVEFMYLNSSTHPNAGAARNSIRRIVAGIVEGPRGDAGASETAHARDEDSPTAGPAEPARNVFAAMVKASTSPAKSPKKRIGRPPKPGVRSALFLLRTLSILRHFEEARRTLGHTASIAATLLAVRAEFAADAIDCKPVAWKDAGLAWDSSPAAVQRTNASMSRMKGVSITEVKLVLKTCQPAGRELAFRVRPHGRGGALFVGPRLKPKKRQTNLG